ncbi:ribonucleoside-diphosphate reductase subunit alpha [Chromobacterium sp. ASV23]|uniref:ribonucleoside-diphosphate reductase subunit alpha n=1 Tax=Chromobacterium sp. ASV23 TaxID=2795110 RepID=UPI0018EB92FF|nr:ribonucleoside-diphosphate reductase subunit alpha [Chromobacterium sp. ASV23]
MFVTKRDGAKEAFDLSKIQRLSEFACSGLNVSQSELELNMKTKFFDGIKTSDIHEAQIISAGELISKDAPDYTFVAARLLLMKVYKEVSGAASYPTLRSYIERGIAEERLNPSLGEFDLEALNAAICPDRDLLFDYLGMQTIADRYLIRERAQPGKNPAIIEMPQHFFMRVAMGLALNEADRTGRAIEFYNVLSKQDFMSSTPTLFNAGTLHSQLSSCYLNKVADTLIADPDTNRYASIMGTIEECAVLSKWAGGIGTDWTAVRGNGDVIKGTNGKSAGIVPYLKIYNDVAVAVNQGGKRMGSFAPYLEVWHPDFPDFCELKKNSGDERRRAHDIFPAGWVCDLFMQRVREGGVWSFFSPRLYPELHELHGAAFETRYIELEAAGKFARQMPALELWRKMITMLFETGHPWITFKDECNRRNPQQHVGVIHNSNLCTEITLNTSDDETAVCNLGSVNLRNHIKRVDGRPVIDTIKLRETIRTAMRMLDNVIDINFYPSERARNANLRHRPVGLGVMGLADLLAIAGVDWESQENLELQDTLFSFYSYFAIEASADLARERGAYPTFAGSLWSKGILPIDTANKEAVALTAGAGAPELDWEELRHKVVSQGMRNSNCMAIAPTATISNITNTTPCVEPPFELEYTKSNLSGTFTVVASASLYGKTKEAFSVNQEWIIKGAAVRQKWIDQAQSTNLFVPATIRGRDLAALYMLAHEKGLKTTYYLRRQIVEIDEVKQKIGSESAEAKMCSIDNPDCESCQ